jgi:hypothetical protein
MTCVHSQSLGRANDRTLATLSAAMAMVRLERIVSSVDKTDRLTDGYEVQSFLRKQNCCQYSHANKYFSTRHLSVPIRAGAPPFERPFVGCSSRSDPKFIDDDTWDLWTAPSDHAPVLKRLQQRRCAEAGREAMEDRRGRPPRPLLRVWREHRDTPWPSLLGFWGVPNLQVINRDAHLGKCAEEAIPSHSRGRRRADCQSLKRHDCGKMAPASTGGFGGYAETGTCSWERAGPAYPLGRWNSSQGCQHD